MPLTFIPESQALSKKETVMDRRRFLQTFLLTSSLAPMLLASKKSHNNYELFILSDSPHRLTGDILKELEKLQAPFRHSYSFLNPHPQEQELQHIFTQKGWPQATRTAHAGVTISFNQLLKPAMPSFTLIQGDRIRDVRANRLYSLWEEMKAHPATANLTTIGFKSASKAFPQGEYAACYRNGKLLARFPITEKRSQILQGQRGPLSISLDQGKAWVSESSCAHQICRLSPPVSISGERIICAPNGFLLEIQGSKFVDTVIG